MRLWVHAPIVSVGYRLVFGNFCAVLVCRAARAATVSQLRGFASFFFIGESTCACGACPMCLSGIQSGGWQLCAVLVRGAAELPRCVRNEEVCLAFLSLLFPVCIFASVCVFLMPLMRTRAVGIRTYKVHIYVRWAHVHRFSTRGLPQIQLCG